MACDCREKLVKELRDNGFHQARLNGIYCFVDNKMQFKPAIEVVYHKKKKDGTLCKGESTIALSYPFCPFCGKKFEEDKD